MLTQDPFSTRSEFDMLLGKYTLMHARMVVDDQNSTSTDPGLRDEIQQFAEQHAYNTDVIIPHSWTVQHLLKILEEAHQMYEELSMEEWICDMDEIIEEPCGAWYDHARNAAPDDAKLKETIRNDLVVMLVQIHWHVSGGMYAEQDDEMEFILEVTPTSISLIDLKIVLPDGEAHDIAYNYTVH